MRYEDLLKTKEAKEVTLVKLLINAGGTMDAKAMYQQLHLSKKSLENYIEETAQTLQDFAPACQLTYNGVTLTFQKPPELSLKALEQKIYLSSSKYQILLTLFKKQELNLIVLAQDLSMSESSISRKIKELNVSLQEFSLRIWQGKLCGDESQIRYFYFNLFWGLEQGFDQITPSEQHIIQDLTRGLQLTLTETTRRKLLLWLRITKKRINNPQINFGAFAQQFQPFQKEPLYQKLRPLMQRINSFYALELRPEETMLHFAFFQSMGILEQTDFVQHQATTGAKTLVDHCNERLFHQIAQFYDQPHIEPDLQTKCLYYLTQMHMKLYFFQGDFEIYNLKIVDQLDHNLYLNGIKQHAQYLSAIMQSELQLQTSSSVQKMTLVRYASIIMIVDLAIRHTIRLGVALNLEGAFQEEAAQILALQLKNLNGVQVETFNAKHQYDLVITNTQLQLDAPIYQITEVNSAYDLSEVKRLIHKLA